jgi:hypothetical protein
MALAFAGTILVAYLPYLSVGPVAVLGYLPGYASERGMVNGEQYYLLAVARRALGAQVPSSVYMIFAAGVLGVVAVWIMRDRSQNELRYLRNGLILASLFILLLAPHFSWYFTWLIPFLCFIPSLAVFYLTAASFLLYLTWLGDSPDRMLVLKTLIFVPFLLLSLRRK